MPRGIQITIVTSLRGRCRFVTKLTKSFVKPGLPNLTCDMTSFSVKPGFAIVIPGFSVKPGFAIVIPGFSLLILVLH